MATRNTPAASLPIPTTIFSKRRTLANWLGRPGGGARMVPCTMVVKHEGMKVDVPLGKADLSRIYSCPLRARKRVRRFVVLAAIAVALTIAGVKLVAGNHY